MTWHKRKVLTGYECTHAREKLFQCKFCGNGFSLKGALTKHERTHTGEKSFTCKFWKKDCH